MVTCESIWFPTEPAVLSAPDRSWVVTCEFPRGALPTGHLVNTPQVNSAPTEMAGGEEAFGRFWARPDHRDFGAVLFQGLWDPTCFL